MSSLEKAETGVMDRGSIKMATVPEKASFEVPPPPIPAKDIKETIIADVVVVGSGIAGLTAAVSAAEAGARTALLEKSPTFNNRGLHNAAIASRLQKKAGITVDRDQIIYTIMEFAAYRSNQRLVKLWAENCDKVMDWLTDMAEAAKIEVILDPTTKPWYFPNYPIIHVFLPKHQETLAQMLQDNAQALGVNIRFETPAVRLLREGKGRVTGVIAQIPMGDYVQFNANKAVVLCTGDYGNDRQMVEKYYLARQPWLYVNIHGERFMNEDLPYGYECNQMLQQPDRVAWAVWDAKYDQEWAKMKSQCCKNMGPPTYLWSPQQLTEALEQGNVLKAQTIEELAQKMEMSVETLMSTVARYNELARNGRDADFGKHPDRLTTIEKPPFYACNMEVRRMVILSGLKINTRLQVLDTERNVIPGLYAAGNVSGSFFGNVYPTTVPGLTHSRAWTFGRLAGLNAAAEKV